jgi:hypothetical protein
MKAKKTAVAAPAPAEAPLFLPRFGAGWRLLILPLSVIAPGGGLALGLLYASQQDASARRFGWTCLILALLGGLARLLSGEFHGFKAPDTLTQPFY